MYRGWHETGDPLSCFTELDCLSQIDVCLPDQGINFWPQMDHDLLQAIRRHHPDCLIILNTRPASDIARSMMGWGDLHHRLIQSDIPGLPAGSGNSLSSLIAWVEDFHHKTATHFAGDPNFIMVNMLDRRTPTQIANRLGITIRWWGIANHTQPRRQGWIDWILYPFRRKTG